MSSTFGDQPGDVVTSSRGDVLEGVSLSLYPTRADAVARTNLLGTVATNLLGRWSYTHATLAVVWVRTLDGQVYGVEDPTANTAASAVTTAGVATDAKIVAERATERANQDSTFGRRRQPTLVVIGDSLIGKGDGPGSPGTAVVNVSYHPDGYWTHALNLLGGRMRFLSNLGVGGTTSTQVLATVPAALALNPGFVLENCGVNDIATDIAGSAIQVNKTAIWDAIEAGGARPIASTITPLSSYTGGQKATLEAVNIWIRDQARVRKDLILIDPYASMVNPIGGVIQAALTPDGTHPSAVGAFLIGRQLATALSPYLPPTNTELCSSEGESTNLIATASRFASGGNGSVNTDTAGQYSDHMPSTTWSKVARTDGINGSWQVFTVPNGATAGGWVQFNVNIGAAVAVGDTVIASVEYDLSNLDQVAAAASQGFNLKLQSYNGASATDIMYDQYWINGVTANMSAQARSGVLRTPPVVVPAGTTILLVLIQMFGGGTYKLDRTTLLNVTQRALTGN